MKFRTRAGMTEFKKEYIAAWTEHGEGTDVHLLCGSIFTVDRMERKLFSEWMGKHELRGEDP
jgi:hypothetical protein|tara:strand:+ start:526 stop:711 length:186 start_codon:yes stop_codon:yes gene_type:complete